MSDMNKTSTMPSSPERKDAIDLVKDRAKDMAANAERVAGAAKERAKEMTTAAKEKVSEAATAAGDLAVQVKDKVQEWSATAADEAKDAVQEVAREVTTLVRRYPIQSLIVGVAVGFLLARATVRS
jgi:ElaB/YqjD/DUF883 family membrane-anchored ribosome-binding protein